MATVKIKGLSPLSWGRHVPSEREDNEPWQAYEERVWRQKAHVNERGNVCVPAMAFKYALDDAAKRCNIKIPGGHGATLTKHFASGLMLIEDPEIQPATKPDAIDHVWIYAHADGKRGSGTRVDRCFPIMHQWSATLVVHVLDDVITEENFLRVMKECGLFCGVGRWRVANKGLFGRWSVEKITWTVE